MIKIKNIFLFIIIFFSISNTSFGGWYYGETIDITKGSGKTECSSDGDYTGGKFTFDIGTSHNGENICGTTVQNGKYECDSTVDINNDGIINTNDYTSTESNQKVGNLLSGDKMICLFWDNYAPDELEINYINGVIQDGNTQINDNNIDIEIKAKDKGGSKIKKIILYRKKDNGTFNEIKNWDNINSNDITKNYTDNNLEHGSLYSYKIEVYDKAGNYTIKIGGNIKYIEPFYYEDDDSYARKNIEGFLIAGQKSSIFWNNYKIEKFIDDNTNNNLYNEKLGEVGTGILNLTIDKNAEINLIKLDKNKYMKFNKFEKLSTHIGNINTGSGYIRLNGGNLELTTDKNQAYIFNFKNYDYIIFLKNNTNQILKYKLYGINKDNNKGIYINPINDSNDNSKGYYILGYSVIIDEQGHIIGLMKKSSYKK